MKPHKQILAGSFFILFFVPAFSQNLQTTIKIQAMEMAKALVKNDFAAFAEFMHPKIIAYSGGKEKLKQNIDSANAMMKQYGISFKKILIGNPGSIITYHDQLQCVVPQATTMQTMLGELEAETSLIAISLDKGKKWYFVDTNMYKMDKVKGVLPDLSPALVVPPQKQPKFTPQQQQ